MKPMITIRASSLGELFDCPARWEAKHILGLRSPSSGAAQLGTAVHASTAVFDQSRIDGAGLTIDDAAGALVDAIHKPGEDVQWDELKPIDAEKIGLALHAKYCSELAPKQDYANVELACEKLEITDLGITLSGTTDRVRRIGGKLGIADLKTGARAVGADGAVSTAGHAAQLGVYELLAEFALGQSLDAPAQIIGMQTGKTAASQRIGTGEVKTARQVLVGDEESPGLLQHASNVIHSGLFYGNPRSMLCSEKYCPAYKICKWRG